MLCSFVVLYVNACNLVCLLFYLLSHVALSCSLLSNSRFTPASILLLLSSWKKNKTFLSMNQVFYILIFLSVFLCCLLLLHQMFIKYIKVSIPSSHRFWMLLWVAGLTHSSALLWHFSEYTRAHTHTHVFKCATSLTLTGKTSYFVNTTALHSY